MTAAGAGTALFFASFIRAWQFEKMLYSCGSFSMELPILPGRDQIEALELFCKIAGAVEAAADCDV